MRELDARVVKDIVWPTEDGALREKEVFQLLQKRYAGDAWVVLPHVPDATGYGQSRTADAIVASVWPSRGLHLHGFEIKCSRADWLRELKDPAKAENISKFCHFWWLVISDYKIVKDGELPETWGLLVVRNGKLFAKKKAPEREAQLIEMPFLCALLRATMKHFNAEAKEIDSEKMTKRRLKRELEVEYQRGYKVGRSEGGVNSHELTRLRTAIEQFEKASGVKVGPYDGKSLGELVKLAKKVTEAGTVLARTAHLRKTLIHVLQDIDAAAVEVAEVFVPDGAKKT